MESFWATLFTFGFFTGHTGWTALQVGVDCSISEGLGGPESATCGLAFARAKFPESLHLEV